MLEMPTGAAKTPPGSQEFANPLRLAGVV